MIALAERIRAHELVGFDTSRALPRAASNNEAVASLRPFTPETYLERGGYAGSLYAPTDAASLAWRVSFLRETMPSLPVSHRGETIDPGTFWPKLAEYNGTCATATGRKMQSQFRLDHATFQRCLWIGEQHDMLFALPHWSEPGTAPQNGPLNYFRDVGLVRALHSNNRAPAIADRLAQKAHEGAVISALCEAAGVRAKGRVWRSGADEIDLILDWANSRKTWAIEITSAPYKKLTKGSYRGFDETHADRRIVVDRGIPDRQPTGGIDRMTLMEVLRDVMTQSRQCCRHATDEGRVTAFNIGKAFSSKSDNMLCQEAAVGLS